MAPTFGDWTGLFLLTTAFHGWRWGVLTPSRLSTFIPSENSVERKRGRMTLGEPDLFHVERSRPRDRDQAYVRPDRVILMGSRRKYQVQHSFDRVNNSVSTPSYLAWIGVNFLQVNFF
jgi:hypothetical protein